MLDEKVKEIFNLVKRLYEKRHMEDFEIMEETENNNDLIDIAKNKKKYNNRDLNDRYIFKEAIIKGKFSFGLYLIHYEHVYPIALSEDYQPLPLNKKLLFEYGAVISFQVDNYYLDISGVFGGIEEDKESATNKYNQLRQYINMMSEEKLLDAIEKNILKKLNS